MEPRRDEADPVVFLAETPLVRVGTFRSHPADPRFHDAGNEIENCVFVFPRTSAWITHEGAAPFLGDPSVVAFYNPGQRFRRDAASRDGDRSEWFSVNTGIARQAALELDPAAADRPERPFLFTHGPDDPRTYLLQRTLFGRLGRGEVVDALELEETAVTLLRRVLRAAHAAWDARIASPPGGRHRREDAEIATEARLVLGTRYADPLSLGAVAAALGVSHFRLCRAFRRHTGTTLHAYREQLRMSAALERLAAPGADLTGVALDLGYSSHSHFSANFRRVFGRTPSAVRGLVGPVAPGPLPSLRSRTRDGARKRAPGRPPMAPTA